MKALVSAAMQIVNGATRANRMVVLIYHRVRAEPDPLFPEDRDLRFFESQMRMLARYCNPLSVSEGLDRMREGRLPSRAVTVTFDDGYADNCEVALPILLKTGVPASFFVSTAFLDGGRMWNDSVIEAVRRLPAGEADLTEVGLGPRRVADAGSRRALIDELLKAIKHLPAPQRADRSAAMARLAGLPERDSLMMSTDQVRKLHRSGMTVGGHTQTHPILRVLDDADAEVEMAGGKARLEEIIGAPVSLFAYPNGKPGSDYDERHVQIAKRIGFKAALSTTRGAAHAGSDPYQLPRFTPWDHQEARWLARLLLEYRNPR